MKKILIVLGILVLLIIGFFMYKFNFRNNNTNIDNRVVKQDFSHDGTYTINGQKVILNNGISEISTAPSSTSKIITKYFGNDLKHDLNEDGRLDNIFLLTQETGGSGIFYYIVALLDTASGTVGSNGILLGDRIAPQTINIDEGKTINGTKRQNVIVVNYADRKSGESFAVTPSVGKSIWLKLDPKTMQFGVVEKNFEGEANLPKMTLGIRKWEWVKTLYSDDKLVTPLKPGRFSLIIKDDKTFSVSTDCNGVGGEYIVKGNNITFNKMMSTLMYCEGSQEAAFIKMLNETQSYLFTPKGELVLTMKFDSGSIFFK